MIVKTPKLRTSELEAIDRIWQLQQEIAPLTSEPNRWTGLLRRQAMSRAVRASNSIEGIEATLPQVQDLLLKKRASDLDPETQAALTGYRDAMTFTIQLAKDQRLELDETYLKSCHFMLLKDDLEGRPGRFRGGPVFVRNEQTGEIVYEGAPASDCQKLVAETLKQANDASDEFDIVSAAMAHLNLVLIHPFKDGNGRMARILQSAVLARTNRLSPVFLSIEEHLAANTTAYYRVLAKTGGPNFDGSADASEWVRFCLEAHWQQANRVRLNAKRTNLIWVQVSQLASSLSLNERCISPLAYLAGGGALNNETYRALVAEQGDSISMLTASRDLALLTENKLLEAKGENRARSYTPSETLSNLTLDVEAEIRIHSPSPLIFN